MSKTEELLNRLKKHTHHLTTCETSIQRMVSGKCTCGLRKLIREIKQALIAKQKEKADAE